VLAPLYPTIGQARALLEISGVRTDNLRLEGTPDNRWSLILTECANQGKDALESLLVEALEAHPESTVMRLALKDLSRGDLDISIPSAPGQSLIESIVRDPLEGTEILVEFAEAQGRKGAFLLQLKRCHQVLLEIARVRSRQGRTMKHEKRWKQVTYEILELARELSGEEQPAKTKKPKIQGGV